MRGWGSTPPFPVRKAAIASGRRVPQRSCPAQRAPATAARVPNTANIAFDFVEAEAVLLLLDQLGICASSGSACTTGSLDPSHVLTAMGLAPMRARGSVRFSLGIYNTEEEVDYVLSETNEFSLSNIELNGYLQFSFGRFSIAPSGSVYFPLRGEDRTAYGYWQLNVNFAIR